MRTGRLNELNLAEAIEGLKKGDLTSVRLVKACYERIKEVDGKVQAFVTLTEERALKEAEHADKLIAEKGPSVFKEKPLLGVPYACKDNFSTKDIKTTASSNVLKNYIPPYESTVTLRLQEAGAVLLGKTNMDAFAHGSSGETSDLQITKNPWDLAKVPGGSSAGSAAAIASNMCIFSIGSETAGSIRGPAAWCGVTGLKPTYGRVSRYGVIAMASSTDSPGPITKTVEDSVIVLKVIAGKDPFDATSSPKEPDNYHGILEGFDLKGVKIGKPASYFEIDLESGVKQRVSEAVEKFRELGAEIIEMDLLDPKYSIAVYTILQRSEVSSNLARFDGIRYGESRDAFGFEAKKRMMLGAYTLSAGYYDQYYAKAQRVRTLIVEDFNKAFESVDMVIGPSMPCVALNIGESDKSPMFGELMDVLAEPSSIAGLPGISVSCGFSDDLPVGVQLIGPQFSESKIAGVAHVYQKSTEFHLKTPNINNKNKEDI
jgi:aspartyl-tRNA(Asn)/glutamyl-tRNA(Gln) amidotransferase subunit A